MNPCRSLAPATARTRRFLRVLIGAVVAGALGLGLLVTGSAGHSPPAERPPEAGRMQLAPAPDWPLFGGTPGRNMVAPLARGLPADWGTSAGGRNVKWVVELGRRGYLPPAVAGGRVYVATNNARPRDPRVKGARAVLMCLRESDGARPGRAADRGVARSVRGPLITGPRPTRFCQTH